MACLCLLGALALPRALAPCPASGCPALLCARAALPPAAAHGALALLCALAPCRWLSFSDVD
eukprot:6876303-Lingulodinium_polyedra.AAC.1